MPSILDIVYQRDLINAVQSAAPFLVRNTLLESLYLRREYQELQSLILGRVENDSPPADFPASELFDYSKTHKGPPQ